MENIKEDEVPDMQEIIKQREEKWQGFFDKYKKYDKVDEDDVVLSDYSEAEMTDGESYIVDDEVENVDDRQSSDDECIEVDEPDSGDDRVEVSQNSEFGTMFGEVFRQLVKQKIEVMEQSSRSNFSEEIKTDNSHKIVKTEKVKQTRRSTISGMDSPMPTMLSPQNANNNENNCMALVKPQCTTIAPYGTDSFGKKGVRHITKTTTTTTTTTVTETIQEIYGEQNENDTPKKVKQPKTVKNRKSGESNLGDIDEFDTNFDVDESFKTPKMPKKRTSAISTPISMKKIDDNRIAIELTPTSGKRKLDPMQIKNALSETVQNGGLDEKDVERLSEAKVKNGRVSMIFTPVQKAITAGNESADPMFLAQSSPRTVLVKTRTVEE